MASNQADQLFKGNQLSESRKIVIAGTGAIGGHLAKVFSREGHDVTIIDISADQLYFVDEIPQEKRFVGNLGNTRTLQDAGVADADIFIASSSRHEVNVIAAIKAKSIGAKKVAALVEDVIYFDNPSGIYRDWLGIDLVLNNRFLVAAEIGKLIRTRGALAVEAFAENRTQMVQFRVNNETAFTDKALKDLNLPSESLVVAIKRGPTLMIPGGDDSVRQGDEVLILGRVDKIAQLEKAFGRGKVAGRKTVILGGGTVGYVLARQLSGLVPNITMIEKDRPRCEFLSRELDSVTVIHGDGTDVDLLQEEGIGSAEIFAAVTGQDEKNIIAAKLARDLGAERCIAMVSRPDYTEVCKHLGLEVVLSPRKIVLREMVRALLPSGIISITPVMGDVAEFVEFAVSDRSLVAGKKLSAAGFPGGSVVCALLDGKEFKIPWGETEIQPGMRAIVFCHKAIRPRVDALFL